MVQIKAHNQILPQFLDLAVDIFYTKKNRHFSVAFHFPWIEQKSNSIINLVLSEGNQIYGGLVILIQQRSYQTINYQVGLIGLVCVDEKVRGQGHSKRLLMKAIEIAKERSLDFLTLWTGQPEIYEPAGFRINDPLRMMKWAGFSGLKAAVEFTVQKDFPYTSVPGYTLEKARFVFGKSWVDTICDTTSIKILRWGGVPSEVVEFLKSYPDRPIEIILDKEDELLQEVGSLKVDKALIQVNQQMWLTLNEKFKDRESEIMTQLKFSFLDRI